MVAPMPISGFLLVITAAFCHATWNVLVKRINGGPELIWLFSTVACILYAPLVIWVLVVDAPSFDLVSVGFILGSALLHLGYLLLLQAGYRVGDLSLVYPIARATGPVLSTGFALAVLGEVVTLQMALGAVVIIFGVLMLSGGIRAGAGNVAVSVGFGLAVGGIIGSYTVWDAYAVSVLLVSPILLDYASSLGRMVCLAPYAHRRRDLVRQHWRDHKPAVMIIAIVLPLAYILVLYALTFTPVAYVAPTREVSVVLTVLAGSLLLNEGHLRHRLVWACVILVGMSLLVTG